MSATNRRLNNRMMKLYLIRHGQTTHNAGGKHQGWGPIRLSEKGMEQARTARSYLSALKLDKIYASPLLRTRQTAEFIFPDEYHRGLITFSDDLREVDTGPLSKYYVKDLDVRWGEEYTKRRRDMDLTPYGIESSAVVRARAAHFLETVLADAEAENLESIAVVLHAGIIRAMLTEICGLPAEIPLGRLPFEIDNCSVTTLEYGMLGWRIRGVNYQVNR